MEIHTIEDLIKFLQERNGKDPIILGAWNGYTDTYTVADHVFTCPIDRLLDDLYGTRGKTDKRLLDSSITEAVYIGSKFHRNVSYPEIDMPDDPNTPIDLINGPSGDHDLFWKSNGFTRERNSTGLVWILEGDGYKIMYYPLSKFISVSSHDQNMKRYKFEGSCIGLEDFFDITKACKIDKTWRIG